MLSRVRLLATPWTVAHQVPLSMGILQARILEKTCIQKLKNTCPPPGYLPNPGIEHRSTTWQVDSLPSKPPGKPKNTGVGSLFLLQGIFPTQGLNPGLPHCRRILYHLSHQGSPRTLDWVTYPIVRESLQPRAQVSHIVGGFFTS